MLAETELSRISEIEESSVEESSQSLQVEPDEIESSQNLQAIPVKEDELYELLDEDTLIGLDIGKETLDDGYFEDTEPLNTVDESYYFQDDYINKVIKSMINKEELALQENKSKESCIETELTKKRHTSIESIIKSMPREDISFLLACFIMNSRSKLTEELLGTGERKAVDEIRKTAASLLSKILNTIVENDLEDLWLENCRQYIKVKRKDQY